MASGRMFSGKKLALTSAFAVLLVAAFGAGCKGFFTGNSLTAVSIQPPTPQVEVGQTTSLQAWGTYQDNTRGQITSGVAWTSSGQGTTINVDPNTGELSTPTGSSGGQATITASAQGISGTAQATAYLGTVTSFTVCTGVYNTGTCPAATWDVKSTSGGSQTYYARGISNGVTYDLTTSSTWTVTPTPGTGSIDCTNSGASPETCTEANPTSTGNYVLTVTYPGVPSVTANITVD
jgi:Bacterial Ig-like domain (group 2)